MELRVLRYFLAIAREESITGAARTLHISQPALSRQMMELEAEIGKPLLRRGSRRVTLTEEGRLLRQRAEDILSLVRKTEDELTASQDSLSGDIYLCAGETETVHILTDTAHKLRQQHPDVRLHISSGDTLNVYSALDKGLADFGLMFEQPDIHTYESLRLPEENRFGVLMLREDTLAQKEQISLADLARKPLILQRSVLAMAKRTGWAEEYRDRSDIPDSGHINGPGNHTEEWRRFLSEANIAGSYSLIYNASQMVRSGMGCALCFDKLISLSEEGGLCFRPLTAPWTANAFFVWKRYHVFSRAAERYLQMLREEIAP